METNEELIKEARAFASGSPLGKPVARELDKAIGTIRRLADALEAATTEWEYGHEGDTLIGVHANASLEQAIEDAARLTRYWEPHGKRFRAVRRRKAGPWLPAEGDVE